MERKEDCCQRCCRGIMPAKYKQADGSVDIEPLSCWIILIAVTLINLVIMAPKFFFGIIYDALQERYDASKSEVGWAIFLFLGSGMLLGPVISPFVVYYGCRPVAVTSSILYAVGMALCTVAPNIVCFILFFGLIAGIGFGGLLLTTMSIIQQRFPKSRGMATAISALGSTLGAILCPILLEYFHSEYGLTGALLLHSALFVQVILFSAILKSPKAFIQRENSKNSSTLSDLRAIFNNMLDFSVFKEGLFILCIFHFFFFMTGQIGMMSHTVSAAVHQGIATNHAAYLLTILGISNLCIRVLSAVILNFRGLDPFIYTSIGTAMLLACGILAAFAKNYGVFVASMVLMGGFQGSTVTIIPILLVHILGPQRFARSFSLLRVCILPSPVIGGPFMGWLIDLTGEYTASFLVVAVSGFLSTVMALTVYFLHRRRKSDSDDAVEKEPSNAHEETKLALNHDNDSKESVPRSVHSMEHDQDTELVQERISLNANERSNDVGNDTNVE